MEAAMAAAAISSVASPNDRLSMAQNRLQRASKRASRRASTLVATPANISAGAPATLMKPRRTSTRRTSQSSLELADMSVTQQNAAASRRSSRRSSGGAVSSLGSSMLIIGAFLGCMFACALPVSTATSVAQSSVIVGDLNSSLVSLGSHLTDRFQGSVPELFAAYDTGRNGYWEEAQIEALLVACRYGLAFTRPYVAALLLTSLDLSAPYDSRVTLQELTTALNETGWYRQRKTSDASCHAPKNSYCPRFQRAPGVCKGCVVEDNAWPKLGPLPPAPQKTLLGPKFCTFKDFLDCASAGQLTCAQCDAKSGCDVSNVAVTYQSTRFFGSPLVIERSFVPLLNKVQAAARTCGVYLSILSSRDNATDSDTTDAMYRGRAIRFRIKYAGGTCADSTCHADGSNSTGYEVTAGASCFKSAVELGSHLVLQTLAPSGDSESSLVITEATPTAASQEFQAALAGACAPVYRHIEVDATPIAHMPVPSAAVPVADALKASQCLQGFAEAVEACLVDARACALDSNGRSILRQAAAQVQSTVVRAAACAFVRACEPVANTDSLSDAVAWSTAVCGGGSAPRKDANGNFVGEWYPSGVASSVDFVALEPPGVAALDEYGNPYAMARDTALADARSFGSLATPLAGGIRVVDVLSRFHPGAAEYTVTGTLMTDLEAVGTAKARALVVRNRFFRADSRLLRCLDTLHSLEPISIARFYETATEARARGDPDSRHRSGSAALVRFARGNSPGRMLVLVKRVAVRCGHEVAGLPTTRLLIGLSGDAVHIDFEESMAGARKTAVFGAWTSLGAAVEQPVLEKWLEKLANMAPRYMARASCTDAVLSNLELPQPQSRLFTSSAAAPGLTASSSSTTALMPPSNVSPLVDDASDFCKLTAERRKELFAQTWEAIEKQHAAAELPKNDLPRLRAAASACALTCWRASAETDTDQSAAEAEALKRRACDQLVHWLPFTMRTELDACHVYAPTSDRMRKNACFWGACLARTATYASLVDIFTETYSDPGTGQVISLYDVKRNPTPVFEQLNTVYAMQCRGRVTVWLEDAAQMANVKGAIFSLLFFNDAVSVVDVRVPKEHQTEVSSGLAAEVTRWQTRLCRSHAREYVSEYRVGILEDIDLSV